VRGPARAIRFARTVSLDEVPRWRLDDVEVCGGGYSVWRGEGGIILIRATVARRTGAFDAALYRRLVVGLGRARYSAPDGRHGRARRWRGDGYVLECTTAGDDGGGTGSD